MGYYSTMWILLPAIILAFYAQSRVKANYNKFAKVRNATGMTGSDVAKEMLRRNGLSHVQVLRGRGKLTDHYNPKTEAVTLSPHVFDEASISAASIAAHECGHAVQHSEGYAPLNIRSTIVPVTNMATKMSPFLIFGGLIFAKSGGIILLDLGIIAYIMITLFHVITLPVEFNASHRAINMLNEYGMVYEEDMVGTKKVLNAAALTYVAAMLSALLSTIRLIVLRNNRN